MISFTLGFVLSSFSDSAAGPKAGILWTGPREVGDSHTGRRTYRGLMWRGRRGMCGLG